MMQAAAPGEMDGGGQPEQAEQDAAEMADMGGGQQVATGTATDGP